MGRRSLVSYYNLAIDDKSYQEFLVAFIHLWNRMFIGKDTLLTNKHVVGEALQDKKKMVVCIL